MSYGHTGTGKTYTMGGRTENRLQPHGVHSGIIPRALDQIFDSVTPEHRCTRCASMACVHFPRYWSLAEMPLLLLGVLMLLLLLLLLGVLMLLLLMLLLLLLLLLLGVLKPLLLQPVPLPPFSPHLQQAFCLTPLPIAHARPA